jgi:hypothetical protein
MVEAVPIFWTVEVQVAGRGEVQAVAWALICSVEEVVEEDGEGLVTLQ